MNVCVEINKANKLCFLNFQVSLSEAEEKYELESCARLENEKPELLSDVNALQDSVQELKKELSEARKRNDELEMVSEKITAINNYFTTNE